MSNKIQNDTQDLSLVIVPVLLTPSLTFLLHPILRHISGSEFCICRLGWATMVRAVLHNFSDWVRALADFI